MDIQKSAKNSAPVFTVICSYCNRLLTGPKLWEKNARGELELDSSSKSHGICPDCLLENFPQEYLAIQKKRRIRIKHTFKSE